MATSNQAAAAKIDMNSARSILRAVIGEDYEKGVPDKMVRVMMRSILEQKSAENIAMQKFAEIEKTYNALSEKKFAFFDGDAGNVAFLDDTKPYMLSVMMPDFVYAEWAQKNPTSPLPHLLYASTLLSQAADDRRASIFVATADQNSPIDEKKIATAREYLLLNKFVASKSGYWYNLMVEIAILEGSSANEIKRIIAEGLTAFPENVQLAVLGSNYFLPKWHGDAQALEDYAIWVSDLPAMKGRPDTYAQIYGNALRNHYGLTLFKFASKNWQRMRPSLNALIKNYPGARNSNMASALACLGGDRQITRLAISHDSVGKSVGYWMDPDAYGLCMRWVGQG